MDVSGAGRVSGVPGTAAPDPRVRGRERAPAAEDDVYRRLTASDVELVEQVTGRRMPPRGPDGRFQGLVPELAGVVAFARASDQLGPTGPLTSTFLRTLCAQYQQAGGGNPISGPVLDAALAFLEDGEGDGRRADVTL